MTKQIYVWLFPLTLILAALYGCSKHAVDAHPDMIKGKLITGEIMNGSHVVIMLENNCGINATVNSYLDVDTIFTITPTQISCDQLHNEALSGDKFGSAQIDASTFNAATDFITFSVKGQKPELVDVPYKAYMKYWEKQKVTL